jgi:hypothetical protein
MVFDNFSSLEELKKECELIGVPHSHSPVFDVLKEKINGRYSINPLIYDRLVHYEDLLAQLDDSTIIEIIQEVYNERKINSVK